MPEIKKLDVKSPNGQKVSNQKAATKTSNKTSRKRGDGSKSTGSKTAVGGTNTSKSCRRRINEIGSVYENNVIAIPGVNGTIVRTST